MVRFKDKIMNLDLKKQWAIFGVIAYITSLLGLIDQLVPFTTLIYGAVFLAYATPLLIITIIRLVRKTSEIEI